MLSSASATTSPTCSPPLAGVRSAECAPAEQAEQCRETAQGWYTGETVAGKKHGTGVQHWPDGSRYQGQFVSNLKHGSGVFTWANGEVYSGEFCKDYRHGDGTYSWPGGSRFIGKFYLNRKEGYGALHLPDGTTFQGLYHADERFGPGVATYPDGQQDVGLWHRDHLLQLCTHLPGAFTLHGFPEYCECLGPREEMAQGARVGNKRNAERQKAAEPFYYDYRKLLEDEHFILPPEIENYSTDSDHLPLPQSLRKELDKHFFKVQDYNLEERSAVSNSLPLLHRMQWHIQRHRHGAEGLDWNIEALLSGRRDGFGPKGPQELNSERLIQEASEGNTQNVYRILQDGLAHVDVGDASGHTALIAAAVNCHNEVINLLLDRGADVNKLNSEGLSALAVSHMLYYPSQTFQLNVAEGMDCKPQEEECAMNCEETTVEVAAHEEADHATDSETNMVPTARTIQVQDGRIKLGSVSWPESHPAASGEGPERDDDVKGCQDTVFDSACSLASFDIDVTEDALQQTAEALSRNSLVQSSGTEETARRMALMKTEHRSRWATIKLLLCRGADPNASIVPMPVLFLAIKAGHTQAVRRLLECGARTDIPLPEKRKGLYPLHIAAALPGKEGIRITELLLHAVSDPDVRAQDADDVYELDKGLNSDSPPGFSMKTSSPIGPPIQYYSPPSELPQEGGRTPLHIACQRDTNHTNAKDVVRLLLSHKANPNLLWSGHSPLSLAIASGNDYAVDELLAGGADPNLPLTRRVGSVLCATVNISYDSCHNARQKAALIEKLINAGANILMPVMIGEGKKTAMGTAVDYAYYTFYQDWRIAHIPYHALTSKEREVYNARRQLLFLMGDLLRQAVVKKDRERLEMELQQGIRSCSPREKFVYTGAGATPPQPKTTKVAITEEEDNKDVTSLLEHRRATESKHVPETEKKIRRPLFRYCYQCGRTVGVVLLPCSRCHEVFYCSKTCKMKAWNERHKEECIRVTEQLMKSPDSVAVLGKSQLKDQAGKKKSKTREACSSPQKLKTFQVPNPHHAHTPVSQGKTHESHRMEKNPGETLVTEGITENYSFN
ncbi:ankyrin repeat and MYND domain-containing protein 1 isoform X2 [Lepisosteus oculatus]|uniref:ankyrin repeat and MYND domain-containing protein 1 isoform X2 n=1 Tax=Lepisosteus oculatus TaxID=7918 RepID=UPI0035F51131